MLSRMNCRAGLAPSMPPLLKSKASVASFCTHSGLLPSSATATGSAAAAVTFPAKPTVKMVSCTSSAVSASPSSESSASWPSTSRAGASLDLALCVACLFFASTIISSMRSFASCLASRERPKRVGLPKDFSMGNVKSPAITSSSRSLMRFRYGKLGSASAPSSEAAATSCVNRLVLGMRDVVPLLLVSSTMRLSIARHIASIWGASSRSCCCVNAGAIFWRTFAWRSPPLPPGSVSIERSPNKRCMVLENRGRNLPPRSKLCMCSS
mmetsp:Transcript_25623/g.59689  ORF Transcript_25623/g.59689 Transcript_25623/m.59689 type:complete len:267 (+) Transcript_25623:561-1361(+)